jgi:two-component system, sensor histidine kinase and response regulator
LKPKTLNRTLPLATFEVVYQLLQQMAELPGAIWLTDEDVRAFVQNSDKGSSERFAVVVSEQFSALLRGKQDEFARKRHKDSAAIPNSELNVELTFEPEAIANFLSTVIAKIAEITPVSSLPFNISTLKQAIKNIGQNSAVIQSEFTLNLLEILTGDRIANNPKLVVSVPTEINHKIRAELIASETLEHSIAERHTDAVTKLQIAPTTCVSFCQSVEDALQQQLTQERLLNQVTTQIRQSLELPTILSKAVDRVREFLEVDRLVIYQFEKEPILDKGESEKEVSSAVSKSGKLKENSSSYTSLGRITYEALANDTISSVLNFGDGAQCLPHGVMQREKYRKGLTFAVADVEKTYSSQPCFLDLMRRAKVRAKLVVPIVVQEQLWGLLIAHHSTCMEWEESKKTFLRQIAEHLAIAIYQAELYAEVQQQKRTLEQRVIDRTLKNFATPSSPPSQQALPKANF